MSEPKITPSPTGWIGIPGEVVTIRPTASEVNVSRGT